MKSYQFKTIAIPNNNIPQPRHHNLSFIHSPDKILTTNIQKQRQMRSPSIGNKSLITHTNNIGYRGQVGNNTNANYYIKKTITQNNHMNNTSGNVYRHNNSYSFAHGHNNNYQHTNYGNNYSQNYGNMIPGHMVQHNNTGVNIKTNHVSTIHSVNPNNSITHNPNPNHIPNPIPNQNPNHIPIPIPNQNPNPIPIQNQNYNLSQSPIITSRKNQPNIENKQTQNLTLMKMKLDELLKQTQKMAELKKVSVNDINISKYSISNTKDHKNNLTNQSYHTVNNNKYKSSLSSSLADAQTYIKKKQQVKESFQHPLNLSQAHKRQVQKIPITQTFNTFHQNTSNQNKNQNKTKQSQHNNLTHYTNYQNPSRQYTKSPESSAIPSNKNIQNHNINQNILKSPRLINQNFINNNKQIKNQFQKQYYDQKYNITPKYQSKQLNPTKYSLSQTKKYTQHTPLNKPNINNTKQQNYIQIIKTTEDTQSRLKVLQLQKNKIQQQYQQISQGKQYYRKQLSQQWRKNTKLKQQFQQKINQINKQHNINISKIQQKYQIKQNNLQQIINTKQKIIIQLINKLAQAKIQPNIQNYQYKIQQILQQTKITIQKLQQKQKQITQLKQIIIQKNIQIQGLIQQIDILKQQKKGLYNLNIIKLQQSQKFDQFLKAQLKTIGQYKQIIDKLNQKNNQLRQKYIEESRKNQYLINQIRIKQMRYTADMNNIQITSSIELTNKQNIISSLNKKIITLQQKYKFVINDNKAKDQFLKMHLIGRTDQINIKEYIENVLNGFRNRFGEDNQEQRLKMLKMDLEKAQEKIRLYEKYC